jgi:hypothetical protein
MKEDQIKEFLETVDNIPNFEHEPNKFMYLWNIFLYNKTLVSDIELEKDDELDS